MINTSGEYKQVIQERRNFVNYADITLSDGTVLNLAPKDFSVSGCTSTDDVTDGSSFSIGNAIAKSITLRIMNDKDQFSEYSFIGAAIVMYTALPLSNSVEKLLKGTYYVNAPETSGSVIEVSAFDKMVDFDRLYDESTLAYPATLQAILSGACMDCGVPIGFGRFERDNFVVAEKPEGVTYRQVVSYVVQIAGYNARISRSNALQLIWYDFSGFNTNDLDGGTYDTATTPYSDGDTADGGNFTDYTCGDTFDGGNFAELNGMHFLNRIKDVRVAVDDVVITGVVVSFEDTSCMSGQPGYVITIDSNPFVKGQEMVVATALGLKLVGMQFRPYTCSSISDPTIEAGDVCYVYDRKGNEYKSIVTNVLFTTGSWTSVACNAESPLKNSSAYFSEAAKAVVQARRNTQKQISTYDLAVQNMNNLAINALGYYETVQGQPDGSRITIIHDKPELSNSKTQYKQTSSGFFLSTDYGKTWMSGFDLNGNAVLNVLSAIGINCDWLHSGTLKLGGTDNVDGVLEVYDGGTPGQITRTILSRGDNGNAVGIGYKIDEDEYIKWFHIAEETSYENETVSGETIAELAQSIADMSAIFYEDVFTVESVSGAVITYKQVRANVGNMISGGSGSFESTTVFTVNPVVPTRKVLINKSGMVLNLPNITIDVNGNVSFKGAVNSGSTITGSTINGGTINGSTVNVNAGMFTQRGNGYLHLIENDNEYKWSLDLGNQNVNCMYNDGGWRWVNGGAYPVYKYLEGAFNPSDIRTKENIEPLADNLSLKIIMGTKTYAFNFKDNQDRHEFGVIAQEVDALLKEIGLAGKYRLVDVPEDEEQMLSVEYKQYIPHLINVVQSQQKEIESLKETVTKLAEKAGGI